MNLFYRLPLATLQCLVGVEKLSDIANVLKVLDNQYSDTSLIYSRKFLSEYIYANVTVNQLFDSGFFNSLLNCLSGTEFEQLCNELNIPDSSRLSQENEILKKSINKDFRHLLLPLLGLEKLTLTDSVPEIKNTTLDFVASESPYKPLKDYQFDVYSRSITALEPVSARFVLQMPTGSGKTRTAMELVCSYLNANPNSTVIWIAHSNELCEQACQCFSEIWPHLARLPLRMQRHYSVYRIPPIAEIKAGFFCSTFQSLRSLTTRNDATLDTHLHRNKLIIVDEAHKATATTYKEVITSLIHGGARVVGLTATPGRSYNDEDCNKELSDFFFNKIISYKPDGCNAIESLRNKGVLSKAVFEPLIISGGQSFTLSSTDLSSVKKFFDLPPSFLIKLGTYSLRNAEIISRIVSLITNEGYKSIIYFGTSLDQSMLISSILGFLKVKAVHIDGNSPASFRERAIKDFREQRINVICNYEVLSTGFDAPLVDCVFIARPTTSVVLYSQMIGRGLRGPEIGGNSKCLVINVKDNITNLPGVDEMFDVFEDYWSN